MLLRRPGRAAAARFLHGKVFLTRLCERLLSFRYTDATQAKPSRQHTSRHRDASLVRAFARRNSSRMIDRRVEYNFARVPRRWTICRPSGRSSLVSGYSTFPFYFALQEPLYRLRTYQLGLVSSQSGIFQIITPPCCVICRVWINKLPEIRLTRGTREGRDEELCEKFKLLFTEAFESRVVLIVFNGTLIEVLNNRSDVNEIDYAYSV